MSSAEVASPPVNETSTSSNAARARAEARRRRILENSASRLTRITGRQHEPISIEPEEAFDPIIDTVAPKCCTIDRPVIPTDHIDNASVFSSSCTKVPQMHLQFLDDEISDILNSIQTEPQIVHNTAITPRKEFSFIDTGLHIPLICIVVHALYISNSVTDAYLFFPLFIWEFIEFFYFNNSQESSPFDLFLPLMGFSPNKLVFVLKVVNKLSHVIRDVFLYTFTTIAIQFLLSFLRNYW